MSDQSGNTSAPQHPYGKRKDPVVISTVPGFSYLTARRTSVGKRHRRNYDLDRKKQVAEIRAIGACLRCRLRKTSVGVATLLLKKLEAQREL